MGYQQGKLWIDYYTLAEMKALKPQFFKASIDGPERYNVRKNHLIITALESGKITVWQFRHNGEAWVFTPVYYPAHESRGDDYNETLDEVLYEVEDLLRCGTLPLHKWYEDNGPALTVDDTKWLCPSCNTIDRNDVTLEDHGVCYECHHEMLCGERCRICYEVGHSSENCPEAEPPDTYESHFNVHTGKFHIMDVHESLTNGERNL